MDTKIQILEVKDIAPVGVVTSEDEFLMRLQQNNITKYPDPQKIQIQKNEDRYIFTLFNDNKQETKFAIANGYDVEKFLLSFLDNQKKADQKTANETIAVQLTGLEKNELMITRGISQEIGQLRNQILEHHQRSTNPDVINRRINELKKFFDEQRDNGRREQFLITSKYARSKQERRYREIHKDEAERRLKNLENVEKTMKEIDVSDPLIENKFKNISQELDKLSYNVNLFQDQDNALRNGTADITPAYKIDVTKFSKKDAKDYLKTLESYNKRQAKVNAITGNAVLEKTRAEDLEDFQKYLEDIVNNEKDPTLYPYTPKNKQGYEYLTTLLKDLQNEYPYLPKNIVIKNPAGVEQGGIVNQTGNVIPETDVNTQTTESGTNKVQDANGNWVDATAAGGLFGTIDHATDKRQDKSERGQNFYKSFGNVALLAGGIFLGIKAIGATWRIIRGKEKKGDRGRLGGTAGLLLLTAGRPQDLFKGGYASEKFADLLKMIGFGGRKNEKAESQTQAIEQSTTGAMALFNGMKYEDMKKIIKPDSDGKMKLDPEYRQKQLDAAKVIAKTSTGLDKANAEAKIRFLEAIGKDDPRGLINLALISMDMDWPALNDSANANKLFNTAAEAYIKRTLDLADLMNSKSYQKTNNESDAKIQEYMQGKITLDELEASGAFEKPVALDQAIKDKLRGQVDALDITDPVKKQNLLEAIYQFYQDWNATDKSTFKIEKDSNGNIVISTYGEKTPISLDKKILGLPITFETTKEALRVANLTNKIKSLSRTLIPNKKPPFYLDATGEITFDNTKIYEVWKQDLTLISREGLKDTSRKFADKTNKETYVNYLNGLGVRGGGTETLIPVVVVAGGAALDATEEVDATASSTENLSEEEKTKLDEWQKKLDEWLEVSAQDKAKIKDAFSKFYNDIGKNIRPEIKLEKIDGSKIKLKSYGLYTTIDFDNKTIIDTNTNKKSEIKGFSYEELFNTANLTNNIIDITKNKGTPGDFAPFSKETTLAPLGIKFNDTENFERKLDTRIVSGSGLASISEKLEQSGNVDNYIDYLNDLWLNKQVNGLPSMINQANVNRKDVMEGFKLFLEDKDKDDNPGAIEFKNNKMFSRGYATNIDLKNMTIFGDVIMDQKDKTQAESYKDLFELGDMINKAKKEANIYGSNEDTNPFNISNIGGNIEFDSKQSVWDEPLLQYNDFVGINKNLDNGSNRTMLKDNLNKWRNDGHKTE